MAFLHGEGPAQVTEMARLDDDFSERLHENIFQPDKPSRPMAF